MNRLETELQGRTGEAHPKIWSDCLGIFGRQKLSPIVPNQLQTQGFQKKRAALFQLSFGDQIATLQQATEFELAGEAVAVCWRSKCGATDKGSGFTLNLLASRFIQKVSSQS